MAKEDHFLLYHGLNLPEFRYFCAVFFLTAFAKSFFSRNA